MTASSNGSLLLLDIRARLREYANPVKAAEMQRYMKSEMPYLGVQTPLRKKLTIDLIKEYKPSNNAEYRATLLYLFNHAKYREEWYCGSTYAGRFKTFIQKENIDVFLQIVHLTQWWDIVDFVASKLTGGALHGQPEMATFLREWIKDDNMWIRRTALLTQLGFKDDTDFDLLCELILQVAHESEFFIRKAIGWILREYSKTNPEAVIRFVEDYKKRLSNLSIREALRIVQRS